MSRPTRTDLPAGLQSWDGDLNDLLEIVAAGPFPYAEHAGDETDLESTFPAASYRNCFIWVNHSTQGWVLYLSDGTTWINLVPENFTDLGDVPSSYSGQTGKVVVVNDTEDGLAFDARTLTDLRDFVTHNVICMWASTSPTSSSVGHRAAVGGSEGQVQVSSSPWHIYRVRLTGSGTGTAGTYATTDPQASTLTGFRHRWRFGHDQGPQTAQRAFVGMEKETWTNADPSGKTNLLGFGYDAGDTVWSIITNDGSGSATKTSLGANFPVDATSVYEMMIEVLPGGASANYSLLNVTTGNKVTGTISSDLPATSAALTPRLWVNVGSGVTSPSICHIFMLLEHY